MIIAGYKMVERRRGLQDGREGGGYKMVAWVEGVREMSRGKRLKVTEFSSQTHIF